MKLRSHLDRSNHQVRHLTSGRGRETPSKDGQFDTNFSENPSFDHTCVVTIGQSLPDSVLNIELRNQDGEKMTLRHILDQSVGGIIVCVFSKLSKKVFLDEFRELAPNLVHPYIHLTSVGLSNHTVSMNASIAEECQEYIDEDTYRLLSDPKRRLLDAMGYVRPPARSKTWATRMRRQGRIKCGFFIIQKDKMLYAKQTGTLPNVLEDIATAKRRLHNQWVSKLRSLGEVIPPW
jgi:peroxiredoxin